MDNQSSETQQEQPRIRIQVLSDPAFTKHVRDFIYKTARHFELSHESAFDLKLVSGEVLNNIIVHAYENQKNHAILIEIIRHPQFLELQFTDHGQQKPINPAMARDLSDYRCRGLGLFLISKLADYHYFDQNRESGTKLTIKKRVS